MLKRKFGNRSEWKRVIDKEYVYTFFDTEEFNGYVTLLKVNNVTAPLYVQYGKENVCIVNQGFIWLQHFPTNKHHSLTTMFNAEGEIVQWYIDICLENGIENHVPWMDDLFLDIIVLPNGKVILKDTEELEAALLGGVIDEFIYDMAWEETSKIIDFINQGNFHLMDMSKQHKDYLITLLK
ncbi:MAG: DUF402 domain-containing protein [Paenisporosarcina sp.]